MAHKIGLPEQSVRPEYAETPLHPPVDLFEKSPTQKVYTPLVLKTPTELQKAVLHIQKANLTDLERYQGSAHAEVRKALVERLASEASQKEPDQEMLSWLIGHTDPVMATEHLRQVLNDSASNLNPGVVRALVLGGANKVLSITAGESMDVALKTLQGASLGFFVGLMGAAAPVITWDEFYNPLYRYYLSSMISGSALLAAVGAGGAALLEQETAFRNKKDLSGLLGQRTGVHALTPADEQQIKFFLEQVDPALNRPIYEHHDTELLECIKYAEQNPHDYNFSLAVQKRFQARLEFLMSNSLDHTQGELFRSLASKVLQLNSVYAVEQLSVHLRSKEIAQKLEELAKTYQGQEKARLLLRAGDMQCLLGNRAEGIRCLIGAVTAYQAPLVKDIVRSRFNDTVEGEEQEKALVAALVIIQVHNVGFDVVQANSGYRRAFLEGMLRFQSATTSKNQDLESLKKTFKSEEFEQIKNQYGELFADCLMIEAGHKKTPGPIVDDID